MFVVDETQGLPWRQPNTVAVGQGDKAGLCVSVIAGKIGEFLPVAYRQREIDAAYHDLRLWVERQRFLQAVAGERASVAQYEQRIAEVRDEYRNAQERVWGYLRASRDSVTESYQAHYDGAVDGAFYARDEWGLLLRDLRRKLRNAKRREGRAH